MVLVSWNMAMVHQLQPNRTMPQFGDTTNVSRARSIRELTRRARKLVPLPPALEGELLYVRSNGMDGTRPALLDRVFPVGGYAALRANWEGGQDAITGHFACRRVSDAHYHQDETTFEIYGFAMLDIGHDFKQIKPEWFDTMRVTRLPSFENQYGEDNNTFAGVRQSRTHLSGEVLRQHLDGGVGNRQQDAVPAREHVSLHPIPRHGHAIRVRRDHELGVLEREQDPVVQLACELPQHSLEHREVDYVPRLGLECAFHNGSGTVVVAVEGLTGLAVGDEVAAGEDEVVLLDDDLVLRHHSPRCVPGAARGRHHSRSRRRPLACDAHRNSFTRGRRGARQRTQRNRKS